GIDRHEPIRMLLELVQVHVHALVGEALLLERDHRLERIRQRFGVVVLQSHGQTSMLSSTPPSTAQSCPVTWLAASLSRKAATAERGLRSCPAARPGCDRAPRSG